MFSQADRLRSCLSPYKKDCIDILQCVFESKIRKKTRQREGYNSEKALRYQDRVEQMLSSELPLQFSITPSGRTSPVSPIIITIPIPPVPSISSFSVSGSFVFSVPPVVIAASTVSSVTPVIITIPVSCVSRVIRPRIVRTVSC